MYARIQEDIKRIAEIFLVVRTISIVEYEKEYHNLPAEKIKEMVATRKGDVSEGSTYIIDLARNLSYRFRDHRRSMSASAFRGFVAYDGRGTLSEDATFKDFQKGKQWLIIRESSSSGEVHDSTPIKDGLLVPSAVAVKAVKTKDIGPIEMWRSLYG